MPSACTEISSEIDNTLAAMIKAAGASALSQEFHPAAIREMCRIAGETRFFPLVPSVDNHKSPYLEPVVKQLTNGGHICEVKAVTYEFQRGANEMLCVRRSR